MNSAIKHAVDVLGGPSTASRRLGVSSAAIHDWIRRGRIPKLDMAEKVATLTGVKLQELRPVPKPGYSIFPQFGRLF